MTAVAPRAEPSKPPARQLRLLANLAPAAAVLFGLTTVWLVVNTLENIAQLVSGSASLAQPYTVMVLTSLVLGVIAAVLAGLITYRLGVQVPLTLRGWQGALAERARVLKDS